MTAPDERIWSELRAIVDPCSVQVGRPMDIVSMGLVERVSIRDGLADVELLLTDASCIFFFKFADEIETRLAALEGINRVDVRLNEGKVWTPDRMVSVDRGPGPVPRSG